MSHTRAARYMRKRLRRLQRHLTPCCVCSNEQIEKNEIQVVITGPQGTQTIWSVSNYVKEIILQARVQFYIEDIIIEGSLAIIASLLPDRADKVS